MCNQCHLPELYKNTCRACGYSNDNVSKNNTKSENSKKEPVKSITRQPLQQGEPDNEMNAFAFADTETVAAWEHELCQFMHQFYNLREKYIKELTQLKDIVQKTEIHVIIDKLDTILNQCWHIHEGDQWLKSKPVFEQLFNRYKNNY